jgi:pilus assembly protein Flp/PilA
MEPCVQIARTVPAHRYLVGLGIDNRGLIAVITSLAQAVRRLVYDEDGPTAVEYAVMLALIIGVCLAAVQGMALATRDSFDSSATAIEGALNP